MEATITEAIGSAGIVATIGLVREGSDSIFTVLTIDLMEITMEITMGLTIKDLNAATTATETIGTQGATPTEAITEDVTMALSEGTVVEDIHPLTIIIRAPLNIAFGHEQAL